MCVIAATEHVYKFFYRGERDKMPFLHNITSINLQINFVKSRKCTQRNINEIIDTHRGRFTVFRINRRVRAIIKANSVGGSAKL